VCTPSILSGGMACDSRVHHLFPPMSDWVLPSRKATAISRAARATPKHPAVASVPMPQTLHCPSDLCPLRSRDLPPSAQPTSRPPFTVRPCRGPLLPRWTGSARGAAYVPSSLDVSWPPGPRTPQPRLRRPLRTGTLSLPFTSFLWPHNQRASTPRPRRSPPDQSLLRATVHAVRTALKPA
jgi:hypothetical protein